MQNPILNQIKNTPISNNLNQIKQLMNMVKSAKNPQAALQNMMQNNPQMKQVQGLIDQYGGDPKTAFYKMAEEKGIDPDQILTMLR